MSNDNGVYWEQLKDEQLIKIVRTGDRACEEFMLRKYKSLVTLSAKPYFIGGADRDDIIQEGTIGLFKAIRDYDETKESSFYTFAKICITNQIYNAIKASARKKHLPLHGYVPLDGAYQGEDTFAVSEKNINPETILIKKERISYMEKKVTENLSPLEADILRLYLDGKTYSEIGAIVSKDAKAVDNAMQRIKKKVRIEKGE